jgi:hypothetical protein
MQQATIQFLLRTKNFRQGDRTVMAGKKAGTLSRTGSPERLKETGAIEKPPNKKSRQAEVIKPTKQKAKKVLL